MASYLNRVQSPEARRAKYALARELGMTPIEAARYRDCYSPKLFRHLGLPTPSLSKRKELGLL